MKNKKLAAAAKLAKRLNDREYAHRKKNGTLNYIRQHDRDVFDDDMIELVESLIKIMKKQSRVS